MSDTDTGFARMAAFMEGWTGCLNLLGALAATRALARWREAVPDAEIMAAARRTMQSCLDVARDAGEWPSTRDDEIARSLREIDLLATALATVPSEMPPLQDLQERARRCLRAAGIPDPAEGWDVWEPEATTE